MISRLTSRLLLQLLVALCGAQNVLAGGWKSIYMEGARFGFIGQVAAFGDQIDEPIRVNIVFPPTDNDFSLCRYPTALENFTRNDVSDFFPNVLEMPQALTVTYGTENDCSAEQKARVLLSMQRKLAKTLRFLILVESRLYYGNHMIELQPDSAPVPSSLNDVGLIYLPYTQVGAFLRQMIDYQDRTGASMQLFQDTFGNWSLTALVEDTNYYDGSAGNSGAGFSWFRFVLFTLLIISPCIRAFYLWYAGGGRIRFRRNERGQIVGLRYVSPVPYWLSAGVVHQNLVPVSATMTEEQFNALPEIEYSKPTETANTEQSDDGQSSCESPERRNQNLDIEQARVPGETMELTSPPSQQEGLSDAIESNQEALTTTCTVCSICIDDFEDGERLTLLPRCRHAFHKDCIKPWLMERQGCCPLCKTDVLQESETTESERSTNENEEPARTS